MGVSENSVSLNPMVLLIIIPFLNGYNWVYTLFSDKPIYWLVVLTILKNMKVNGKDYPIYLWKIKNVPNHQPGYIYI